MKIIIRAEDIKKHQALRNKFVSISQEINLSDEYLTLFFKSEMMKEFIMPLIEKKVPYMMVNDAFNASYPVRNKEQIYTSKR